MRIIDKTPLQDEKGSINIVARIQGTLKYGLNWFPEVQAQKSVIDQLDRLLDKGFVLIRNFTLPDSSIVIPLILIGPGSLSVILVTPLKGQFEVKGMEWNMINNGVSTPASRNLVDLIAKLTRAFQKYLQLHNINIPIPAEPALIAMDPGANIESIRPALRVVRSDAVKQFASLLNQARPLLRTDQINAIADLILEPKPKSSAVPPEPKIPVQSPGSRAQAIFKASETAEPAARPSAQIPRARPIQAAKKKQSALTGRQMLLLGMLGIFACCIVAAAAYMAYSVFSI